MAERVRRETTTITFRVPVEFKKRLDDEAAEAALSRSALINSRLFGEAARILPTKQKRIPADLELLRRILGQLGKIGSNHNQIAYHLNSKSKGLTMEKINFDVVGHRLDEIRMDLLRALGIIQK